MNIDNIIHQQGIIYDRYPGQTLTLPYSGFENIKIQPNETVTNFNINNIVSKLYTNYLQLYKYAFIASNVIPITSVGTIAVSAFPYTGKQVSFFYNISTSQCLPFSMAGYPGLDNIKAAKLAFNSDLNHNIIFCSNGTKLYTLRHWIVRDPRVVIIYESPEQISGPSSWTKITDFEIDNNNSLFVLDTGANCIYKYDASGFLTSDNILQNKLIRRAYVGGKGSFDDSSKFNNPVGMTYFNSELYVLDAGNACIKKYDTNLNWEITYRLFKDFQGVNPVQIEHDNFGNIYILLNNNIMYKYNHDFTTKQVFDVDPLTGDASKVIRVVFSPSDDNIFYIVTSNNVYKRLLNDPAENIAKYSLARFGVDTPESITTFASQAEFAPYTTRVSTRRATVTQLYKPYAYANLPHIKDLKYKDIPAGYSLYDRNYIFSNNTLNDSASGKISIYRDSLDPINILADTSFDVYPLSAITIHPDEYLQNWVINKAISKLLINHMRLRDSIDGKFLYQKDKTTGDLILTDIRYLLPNETESLYFDQDITRFIGLNEIFQNNIINRPFEYIYNIQIELLNILKAEIRNYYDLTQIKEI
jgi:hypothetical protein